MPPFHPRLTRWLTQSGSVLSLLLSLLSLPLCQQGSQAEDSHLLTSDPVLITEESDMASPKRASLQIGKMFMELIVLAGVISTTGSTIQRPDYDDTANPEFLNPSWMGGIPDSRSLSEVTLPGTHNTMALYGGALAECESWSLASQLRAGIRFLDIRVRNIRGNLTLHHGVSYQRAHFGHVLEDVAQFLAEYPSEMVLMRLKEEFSETYDIYGPVVSYIHRYAHWDLLWHSRLVPTVGEARGKLIVLQDFAGPDLGMRYGSLNIADDWKVPTLLHVNEKWQSVQEHLDMAIVGNKAEIFLTYGSGAGVFAYPNAVAQRINARIYDYLTARMGQNLRFGIITTDFPGALLLQIIIDFN
ncbi:1-phosphatidylinositol phosphodiesterase isoform X1 [Osmerus mordax]